MGQDEGLFEFEKNKSRLSSGWIDGHQVLTIYEQFMQVVTMKAESQAELREYNNTLVEEAENTTYYE